MSLVCLLKLEAYGFHYNLNSSNEIHFKILKSNTAEAIIFPSSMFLKEMKKERCVSLRSFTGVYSLNEIRII